MQYTHIQKMYSLMTYDKVNIHENITQILCETPGKSSPLDLCVPSVSKMICSTVMWLLIATFHFISCLRYNLLHSVLLDI